ncbi:elongation factor G [Humidesulfovibrio mexicanus]|uniref:Elongation factor G n=1 Tax=Humidesulfovibrio mexicanus TaxID=147047 RepID=A0A238XQL7_9BACT|nr:elongation factor G [Humidesulfovibrio mexicanus]SNR60831.1 elongation factor G [Humidesulfovibrio mexicanus]
MSRKPLSSKYLQSIRNIGIIAHIDAGKTTLSERILFYSGRIHRLGEVHEGTATMDFMPEEQDRGITIASAVTSCQWRGHVVNLIDTPGHVDFTVEVERSLRVLDGAIGVFCAVSGVEPQSETVWRQSESYHVPKLAFVNKMDRLGADFDAVLTSIREKLGVVPLALQVPDGQGQDFSGVFDLLRMERLEFDADSRGAEYSRRPLTQAERERVAPRREAMLETLADAHDGIMEAYLAGQDIPAETLVAAIRQATIALKLVPVLLGSALRNCGVQPLMDAVCDFLPSPLEASPQCGVDPASGLPKSFPPDPEAPLSALVFKVVMDSGRKQSLLRIYSGHLVEGESVHNATRDCEERVARVFRLHADRREKIEIARAGEIVAAVGLRFGVTGDTLCRADNPILLEQMADYKPVISLAIEPRNAEEADKLDEVLRRYLVEDPTLSVVRDEDTGQVVLSGMGELHLEVLLERMAREHGVHPRTGKPQVVHQETVTRAAEVTEEFHRELGEALHYGAVRLAVEPLARGQGREVRVECDRMRFPQAWMEAVELGLADGLACGVLGGYPVQDVRLRVLDLPRREGESSPAGYRMAAAMALKSVLAEAGPQLLEPIMLVELIAPDAFVGEVVGLLGSKGAKIESILDRGGNKLIQAYAPLRQMFGFSTFLRSATQGRASFSMKFAKFDVLA